MLRTLAVACVLAFAVPSVTLACEEHAKKKLPVEVMREKARASGLIASTPSTAAKAAAAAPAADAGTPAPSAKDAAKP